MKLPSKMYQFTQVLKNSIVYFIASELNFTASHITSCLRLFLERLSEKMCTWQSWKVNMGSIHCCWHWQKLSNLPSLLPFSTCKHMSMVSHAILSNFFEKQWTQNHPQYLLGLSRALFPTTFLKIAVYEVNRARLVPCFFLRRRRADLLAKITVVRAANSASGMADLI